MLLYGWPTLLLAKAQLPQHVEQQRKVGHHHENQHDVVDANEPDVDVQFVVHGRGEGVQDAFEMRLDFGIL